MLEKVRKVFDRNTVAVENFNLEVGAGEFVVLVGPSGCGKSTVLRLVAGLEEPTEGNIYIDGILANDLPPKDRDVALVFQNYALYPHMTAYQNMSFSLRLRKYPKETIDARVREAAGTLGISQLLDRRPKTLSGGERQRVAVGRAIVRKPKVFLFDEPLSNLDAKLRLQMRTEISRLHTRLGATMIYVTHDQVEAMTMGDRLVVMRSGRIQQIGPPAEIYERPENLFVAGFIGSPAMNFVDGELSRNGSLVFSGEAIRLPFPDHYSPRLQEYVGRPLVLGIRPEHISCAVSSPGSLQGSEVRAKVELVEPMGHETYLYFNMGGTPLVGRMSANHPPSVGEEIPLAIDLSTVHIFDKETGVNLFIQNH